MRGLEKYGIWFVIILSLAILSFSKSSGNPSKTPSEKLNNHSDTSSNKRTRLLEKLKKRNSLLEQRQRRLATIETDLILLEKEVLKRSRARKKSNAKKPK